jgi:hypothetical protein
VSIHRSLVALMFPLLAATAVAVAQPRPADPLSAAEKSSAASAAQNGATQSALLHSGAFSLVGVELVVQKDATAPSPDTARREAAVLFYRSDTNDGLRVLVDAATGQVLDSATIRTQSVPIGRAEVQSAAALALNNASVQALLGSDASTFHVGIAASDSDNTIEGLRLASSDPSDPCSQQRCIELFFRQRGSYIAGYRFSVNLTTSTVQVTNTSSTGSTGSSGAAGLHRKHGKQH